MIQGMCDVQNQPEAFLDLNADQITQFFDNFGLKANVNYKPIPIHRFELIIQTALAWHGKKFAQYVMDCFITIDEMHFEFDYPVELIPFED